MEENKVLDQTPEATPEEKTEGKPEPKDTEGQSAERIKELEAKAAKAEILEKQIKEKESFIGKQSTGIGELRKELAQLRSQLEEKEKPKSSKEPEDLQETVEFLKSEGYNEEDAIANAKILDKFDKTRTTKRVKAETMELIEEAFEDGLLDKNIYEESKDDILKEWRGRKQGDSARKNLRIFKDCYNIVLKKKADELRKIEEEKSEKKRDALIASSATPSPTEKKKAEDEEKQAKDQIRNAGPERGKSAFF